MREGKVEIEVQPLQILGLKTSEDDAVPGEGGEGKLALARGNLPLPAGLKVDEGHVV